MADSDPEVNLVVMEVIEDGRPTRYLGHAPTRQTNCVQLVIEELLSTASLRVADVTEIYSEWQLSGADADYLARHVPNAQVTWSFRRPADGNWEVALAVARRKMDESMASGVQEKRGRWVRLRK